MSVADLTKFGAGDIIKISKDDKVTLGKVVDATEESVLVFRLPDNIWYSFTEYDIEILESAQG